MSVCSARRRSAWALKGLTCIRGGRARSRDVRAGTHVLFFLLSAQLQLTLDVVVVVDSALGLVGVVLVVVVGVVQGADCSGPLCTTGTSARLPCSNAWVVGARGRNCPPIHLLCTHSLITTTLLF